MPLAGCVPLASLLQYICLYSEVGNTFPEEVHVNWKGFGIKKWLQGRESPHMGDESGAPPTFPTGHSVQWLKPSSGTQLLGSNSGSITEHLCELGQVAYPPRLLCPHLQNRGNNSIYYL